MQNNRLFEILYLLLNKQKTTAGELADKFEVSVRTIYRDIDALSLAGIPVYMTKGKGGGISLMDDFVLQKSLLSQEERDQILIGLQSLRAVQYPETDEILSKLNGLFRQKEFDWIEVDFSGWGSEQKDQFILLKTAILNKRMITFYYFGVNGRKTQRQIEPLRMLYKGKAWYVQGFCRDREDYRIFKLSRMKEVCVTDEGFTRDASLLPVLDKPYDDMQYTSVKMHIGKALSYRVYDEFDEKNIHETAAGFEVVLTVPEDEWMYGYILSFGAHAQVTEPEHVKSNIRERIEKMKENYSNMT
ncbi:MAG: YafY family protein [Christensenella sp.]|uniref:helix-turn-helix transcriptional regulator n=1 Tax=Christensenella sp. TaxID=1935934 RepID=UPI002B1F9665|nr:YafY family protein [Christensenella sp.]MEA5003894.1 YafY family protein [Christensenella sp.]